jgi:hypothetical protein
MEEAGGGGGGILVCVIQLGIPFRGTKIEANSRNSVPNHSVEEKPTRNKTRQANILKIVSEKTTFDVQTNHFVKLLCCCSVKLFFSAEFHSVPFRSELRNWLFRGTRNASE